MQQVDLIKSTYPTLFADLEIKLPTIFFKDPDNASVDLKRHYNDLVTDFFLEKTDMTMLRNVQLVIAA